MIDRRRGRRDRRKWLLVLGVFVAMFSFSFLVQNFRRHDVADAANLAAFDPGYIISDYQMGNYSSMSEGEIQAFLKSKNPCNDTNLGKYTAGNKVEYGSEISPPRTWHVANGHFVCMADEVFDGGTAAHIIYRAANDYRINPQVLLVLLEKEQSLVTDTFPHSQQYRSATGYGCPDTAACSSKYYGLQNQIRNAAALFRTVLDGGWTNYPLGNNYVQYNPNGACGGTVVNIRNRATSALYRYTPYQPNAAVLAGWNDGCGAYGNLNFYKLFEDWFGDIKSDGMPSKQEVSTRNKVATEKNDLALRYKSHVAHYGWLDWANGGEMIGTVGYGLQTEALAMELMNGQRGISYRAYVAGMGWQGYASDGAIAGTTGIGRGIEALKIKLSDDLAKEYDVYYRAHVAGIGWMEWAKNDEEVGVIGESRWIEALQMRIVKKEKLDLNYSAHAAGIGWMEWVSNGEVGGTEGQARWIEALKVEIKSNKKLIEQVSYQAHAAGIGWMEWVSNGEVGGTEGQARWIEAIKIKLSEELAKKYDIFYRVHAAGIGWMEWVSNGEVGGTEGQARWIEAIEIKLIDKTETK